MAEELKTRSFRIEDSTAEQFKAISQEIGGNQQQALSKLIECYELQKGKAVLTEKKEDIETFENYVTNLTNMYLASLQDNKSMRENVRAEYKALLSSKDSTILSLQEKVDNSIKAEQTAKEELKDAIRELEIYKSNIEQYKNKLEQDQENYESIIQDKEALNTTLSEAYTALKKQLEGVDVNKEELEALKSKYEALQEDYASLKVAHDKDLLELERQHSKEVKELNERYITLLQSSKTPEKLSGSFTPVHLDSNKKRASWDCYCELFDKINKLCSQYKCTKNDVINTLLIESIEKYVKP